MFIDYLDRAILAIDNFGAEYLWGYGALFCILSLGTLLSHKANWFQITQIKHIFRLFKESLRQPKTDGIGTRPLHIFFTSLGGCVGIGNLATVAMAAQIGGPGALFWVWVVAFIGMILKYSEVYLALTHRFLDKENKKFMGGSMYFVAKAFPKFKALPYITALLMAIYSIEFYSFNIIKDSFVSNFHVNPTIFALTMIISIFYAIRGGIERVGRINTVILPIFVVLYLGMTAYILTQCSDQILPLLKTIFYSAWNGHAAATGFAGATMLIALSRGASAAAFSGDIGVGYNSLIHIETQSTKPAQQASLALMSIFLDTILICSTTMVLVLITGVWKTNADSALLVQNALSLHFPYMEYFMPFMIFILGYSTIISYLLSGLPTAEFLAPKNGKKIFFVIAALSFFFFSFFKAEYAFAITSLAGGLLLYIHIAAIYRLRHEVQYDLKNA